MDGRWLLLIYTVPTTPSRKRAFIWREVKKIGAVYLHDGVCILPEQPATAAAAEAIAARVREFEGQATLVTGAILDQARSEEVTAEFRAARSAEYAEIVREAERLLEHIARETEHRDFSYAEVEELEQDLTKLKRWMEQIRSRDYFPDGSSGLAEALLARCDRSLAEFLDQAAARDAPP